MSEHSIEHSSENSTRRQAEHSPRNKTKAFAAKRKHSIGKKDEEEDEMRKEGSEEDEEDGVDTDRKNVMRVDDHYPFPAGAIALTPIHNFIQGWLLDQIFWQVKVARFAIFCGKDFNQKELPAEECLGNTRATIYETSTLQLLYFWSNNQSFFNLNSFEVNHR